MKGMNEVCKFYTFHSDKSSENHEFHTQIFKKFLLDIRKISNDILKLSNNPYLRQESLKLIAILISNFTHQSYEDMLRTLLALPEDINAWPKTKSALFFSICSLQFENDR